MRDIDFSSARKLKADLDAKIDSIGERREVCVASHGSNLWTIKVPTLSEMNNLCRQLNKGKVKPVALSLIEPYSDQFVLKSRQILTISGLFDPENMSLSYPDLLKNALTWKLPCQVKKFYKSRKTPKTKPRELAFLDTGLVELVHHWVEQCAIQTQLSHHSHWLNPFAIHIYLKSTQKQWLMGANMRMMQSKLMKK